MLLGVAEPCGPSRLRANVDGMPTSNTAPSARVRRWATIGETADYMHLSTRSIREMIKDGRLRGYEAGPRVVRLDLNEVDAALKPIEP